jgi:hypothetical protein
VEQHKGTPLAFVLEGDRRSVSCRELRQAIPPPPRFRGL